MNNMRGIVVIEALSLDLPGRTEEKHDKPHL
jgi:hypothetical protein